MTVVWKYSGGSADSCEGSGGSALVDTLIKVLQITLDWYYFVIFQDCENMLFIAYSTLFSCFGKWDSMCEYHQHRNGQRGPTLVGYAMVLPVGRILPISCLDHGKIMVRLFSPCNTVDVCVSYGLIGSLVSLHDCGTCSLAF